MPLALINRRTVLAAMAVMGASLALPAFADAPGTPDMPQPDRRDWIMLAVGASGVLSSVGLGYGLARLLRRKPESTAE